MHAQSCDCANTMNEQFVFNYITYSARQKSMPPRLIGGSGVGVPMSARICAPPWERWGRRRAGLGVSYVGSRGGILFCLALYAAHGRGEWGKEPTLRENACCIHSIKCIYLKQFLLDNLVIELSMLKRLFTSWGFVKVKILFSQSLSKGPFTPHAG